MAIVAYDWVRQYPTVDVEYAFWPPVAVAAENWPVYSVLTMLPWPPGLSDDANLMRVAQNSPIERCAIR